MRHDDPVISLRNAYKGWSTGARRIDVLREINLEVYRKQSLAIMGPSGSGKSTLLHLLGLLTPLDQGSIWFDGCRVVPQEKRRYEQLRQSIGIVFQDAKLIFDLTVLENVCLPLAHRGLWLSHQKRIAREVLDQVGLSDRAKHFPAQLSGGELARVAFARVLAIQPRILLADEPTGNLDSETGEMVADLLMSAVGEDCALVLVTHHSPLAQRADRILFIKDGTLASIR